VINQKINGIVFICCIPNKAHSALMLNTAQINSNSCVQDPFLYFALPFKAHVVIKRLKIKNTSNFPTECIYSFRLILARNNN